MRTFALLLLTAVLGSGIAAEPLPPGSVARLGHTTWRNIHGPGDRAALQFLPDGKSIACTSSDGGLMLLDADSGRVIRKIRGPTWFTTHSVTPDGRFAYTSEMPVPITMAVAPPTSDNLEKAERGLRLWNLSTGVQSKVWIDKLPIRIRCFDTRVVVLQGTRSGSATILTILEAGTGITLWESPGSVTGGHRDFVLSGDRLTTIESTDSEERWVTAWDLKTSEKIFRSRFEDRSPELVLTPDGKQVVAYGHHQMIRRWESATGKELSPLKGHTVGAVEGVGFSLDGKLLFSAGLDRTIRWWDLATGKELGRLMTVGIAKVLAPSPDGKRLAAVLSHDDMIRRYDLATCQEIPAGEGHSGPVRRASFLPNGDLITVGDDDLTVRRWSPEGKPGPILRFDSMDQFRSMDVSPDGRRRATADGMSDARLRIRNLLTGELEHELTTAGSVTQPVYSPDSRWLAVRCTDTDANKRSLTLYDAATMKQRWTTQVDLASGYELVFSQDGRFILGLNSDYRLMAWDARDGRVRYRLNVPLETFSITSDGREILGLHLGELSKEWRVYETATGRERLRLTGLIPGKLGSDALVSPAISRDGQFAAIVSGPDANLVSIRSLHTGEELGKLQGHERAIMSAEFSRDGSRLITSSEDSTALIWDMTPFRAKINRASPPENWEDAWRHLGDLDPVIAWPAQQSLAAGGAEAVRFLKSRLRPVPNPHAEINKLIGDLDAQNFGVREKASGRLTILGEMAEPALQTALKSSPTAEARRRIEKILATVDGCGRDPEMLRLRRGMAVLERIGGDAARRVLEALAQGDSSSFATQEAASALLRLKQ